jgi:hypothetical protein
MYKIKYDYVYTVPDEFGTGCTSSFFARLHANSSCYRGSQIRPVPWFSCKKNAKTDEFQPGSKFVPYRKRIRSLCLMKKGYVK